jgi:ribonuclease HI
MGAGSVCFQQQGRHLEVRVGREEEGTTSLRLELAALARTLQATSDRTDLLYLCDSETTRDKVSRWIGRGPRTTLVGDANADIMKTIIECLRARVLGGARTFMVKVKAHCGEPLNEKADTVAERARQLPVDSKQWTTRTPRLLYEWLDKDVKRVSTWSKAVRQAMLQGGAEFQRQRALARAASNWKTEILRTTDAGWARVQQEAGAGVKGDLMNRARWGWECMRQLQETEDRQTPGATTWAADFLNREGKSRDFLGLWFASCAVHEAKKRRATQVITCSFPCDKWLHMIKARGSPSCELCRRERRQGQTAMQSLPEETVAHIQSTGCKAQKKSVTGAHNKCWKYLLCAITKHGKADRNFEFIGEDKDRQLESLWKDTESETSCHGRTLRTKRKGC